MCIAIESVVLSPVADNYVDGSVRSTHHAIKHSIGEPEAFAVHGDEASVHWAVVKTCSHAGTVSDVCHVTHVRCRAVVCQSHLGAVLAHVAMMTVVTCSCVARDEQRKCCES